MLVLKMEKDGKFQIIHEMPAFMPYDAYLGYIMGYLKGRFPTWKMHEATVNDAQNQDWIVLDGDVAFRVYVDEVETTRKNIDMLKELSVKTGEWTVQDDRLELVSHFQHHGNCQLGSIRSCIAALQGYLSRNHPALLDNASHEPRSLSDKPETLRELLAYALKSVANIHYLFSKTGKEVGNCTFNANSKHEDYYAPEDSDG